MAGTLGLHLGGVIPGEMSALFLFSVCESRISNGVSHS